MSALSNYLENALLGLILNKDAFTGPSTWVSLYTTDPTDADSGTEVSGGSYARVRVYDNASGTPDWNTAVVDGVGYLVDNSDDITFPTATAAWGTVTHFGIHDAVTAGNLLYHGALDSSQVVGTGGIFKFLVGELNLKLE
jgi:hypothetical protein